MGIDILLIINQSTLFTMCDNCDFSNCKCNDIPECDTPTRDIEENDARNTNVPCEPEPEHEPDFVWCPDCGHGGDVCPVDQHVHCKCDTLIFYGTPTYDSRGRYAGDELHAHKTCCGLGVDMPEEDNSDDSGDDECDCIECRHARGFAYEYDDIGECNGNDPGDESDDESDDDSDDESGDEPGDESGDDSDDDSGDKRECVGKCHKCTFAKRYNDSECNADAYYELLEKFNENTCDCACKCVCKCDDIYCNEDDYYESYYD